MGDAVTWQWSVPAALMVGAAAVLFALAAYVVPRRRATGGVPLLLVLLAVATWSLAYGLELAAVDLTTKGAWGDAKYLGINLLAPAWLAFSLAYTGRRRRLSRRALLMLSIEPITILGLLLYDPTHDWVRYYPPEAAGQQFPVVGAGWAFWAHLAYTNALIVVGTTIFVVSLARISRVYWRQSAVLLVAALGPWIMNVLYNAQVGPFARVDFTPAAFALTAVVIVWGVFRQRLLDLVPAARSLVLSTMPDGVLVLDAYGRVVEVNRAVRRLTGRSTSELVGRDVGVVVSPALAPSAQTPPLLDLHTPDGPRTYEPTRSPLLDARGRATGEVVVLRDVTERVRAERELRQMLAERTRVAYTLAQSLLPTSLPAVPGVALAARYRPAGDGSEIGGDFYDVFPDRNGGWMVALGDVSGKGAEAAAVTALVRYTLRTLALQHASPAAVLRELNDVFIGQATDERYCTLACARLHPGAEGVRLTLALAGHPQPLVADTSGGVRAVGRPGTALGLLAEPDLADEEVTLAPGEVLCLYTDGVTEARCGGEWFGEERAAAVLTRNVLAPLPELAGRLEGAVLAFQDDRAADDIAVLLLRPDPSSVPPPRVPVAFGRRAGD